MIDAVTAAEDFIAKSGKPPPAKAALPAKLAKPADIAPTLRGAVAVDKGEGRFDRMISDFRTSDAILDFLVVREARRAMPARGVSTPDLSIRIKTGPMALPAPDAGQARRLQVRRQGACRAFAADYRAYFDTNDALDDVKRTMLDQMPRLTLVPGVGMFGHGRTLKDAKIASDVGEMWIEAVRGAEAIGDFQPLSKADLFPLEYWSLEQAKLASNKPKPLTGQVMLVTGGAGAIGAATAKLFADNGAHVVVVDLDAGKAADAAKKAGNNSIGVGADITDPAQVRAAFDKAVAVYGGVDILVSNAGAAWEGKIGETRRRAAAQELRAQLLRPPVGGAERRAHHEGAGHRRRAAVQRLEAGGQSRREIRRLRPAQGGDAVPVAAICAGIRRGRHPLQRRQRRPHPLGPADRRR